MLSDVCTSSTASSQTCSRRDRWPRQMLIGSCWATRTGEYWHLAIKACAPSARPLIPRLAMSRVTCKSSSQPRRRHVRCNGAVTYIATCTLTTTAHLWIAGSTPAHSLVRLGWTWRYLACRRASIACQDRPRPRP
ncbi:hypothetical protein GY45DRAFT_166891 [Cubamyces sp. BRFM 1775]|nr:hypothetical protein GY45DRAFT_166891 [Cubamyces sp. BRFM 1775]